MNPAEASVVLVCAHTADVNSIVPIAQQLRARKIPYIIVVEKGMPAETASILANEPNKLVATSTLYAAVTLSLSTARVIVSGMGSKIGRQLITYVQGLGFPTDTIAVQDTWAGRFDEWVGKCFPGYFITNDQAGVAITQAAWPDMNPTHILPLGFPSLDLVARLNPSQLKLEVRRAHSIPDDVLFIYYSAQFVQSGTILRTLINECNDHHLSAYILAGKHPRFPASDYPEEARAWEALPQLNQGVVTQDKKGFDSASLVAACDILVSSYSGALTEGCVLRKPCISVLTPEIVTFYKGETKGFVGEFPLAALGCVHAAYSIDAVGGALTSALRHHDGVGRIGNAILQNQIAAFEADGGAAARVAGLIQELIVRK